MNCIFCDIRDDKRSSYKVYEDKYTLAFLDNKPIEDGHVLLIPKEHKQYIEELSELEAKELMNTLFKILPPIKRAMKAKDCNIIINNGPNAGQIIPHVHIHIIPRSKKSSSSLFNGISRVKPRDEEYFRDIVQKIKKEIKTTT